MKSRLPILVALVVAIVLSTAGVGLALPSGTNDASVAQYGPRVHTVAAGLQRVVRGRTGVPAPVVQVARQREAGAGTSRLPFSGFAAIPVLLGGVALAAAGLRLRRGTRPD
jgi:hypothetical protein